MTAPAWCRGLLRLLAPPHRREELVGDLDEAHALRVRRRGRIVGTVLTAVETLDVGRAMLMVRSAPGRRGPRFAISRLDFVLGMRMLVRYPGLTVLGGLAMAFAIFVGAGTYEFLTQVARPELPLPEGDRVVGIRLWNAAAGSEEEQAAFELALWQRELTTMEAVGAYRTARRNLTTADGPGLPEIVAQMTPSGFRVAGVAPALGRPFTEADAARGSKGVVIIGHGVWQRRFGGDPAIIGTTVRLGDEVRTVVGVMPAGFAFPVMHGVWTPERFGTGTVAPGEGPEIRVFGRLAAHASLDDARRELERLNAGLAAEYPATYQHIRPQVTPYARSVLGLPGSVSGGLITTVLMASNLPILLFIVLVAGNVALLLFARAAAREGEMVVRSALGASRGRIIGQLFAEALVLATLAAVLGLAATGYGMRGLFAAVEHLNDGASLPFWFRPGLSAETVVYTMLLTVLVAAVAGGLPGIKVTRGIGDQLRRATAGGGGFRFGGIWTALIVIQIAVMVNVPIVTVATRQEGQKELLEDLPIQGEAYLAARLAMDDPGVSGNAAAADRARRFAATLQRLDERLTADPRVGGVTFTERLPREYHPWRQIEVEGGAAPPPDARGHRLASTSVAVDYFDVMRTPVLSGRNFTASDPAGPGVVIVTRTFADRVLAGQSPVGRRIRYLATEEYRDPDQAPGPWLEIVGVVPDLGTRSGYGPHGIFHPVEPGGTRGMNAVVHVRSGNAMDFAHELRTATTALDPAMRVAELRTLDRVTESTREFYDFWFRLLVAVTVVSLVLSLGGVYAVLAFTAAQRTREIGIRMALGSSRTAVVRAVFRRPFVQVILGTAVGVGLFPGLAMASGGGLPDLKWAALTVAYFLLMTAVCLTACVVPTLRVLRIAPADALRTEG
ncbi:MAG: ABC transporter permease [Gemmatimonadota bacterium]